MIVRWVLGMSFSWHNLGCYFIGVLVVAGVDRLGVDQKSGREGNLADSPNANGQGHLPTVGIVRNGQW